MAEFGPELELLSKEDNQVQSLEPLTLSILVSILILLLSKSFEGFR